MAGPKRCAKSTKRSWEKEHPLAAPFASKLTEEVETFVPPPGYNDTVDHEANFFNAVRCASPASRMRYSATTRPSVATWRTTRTSTSVPRCGMRVRRR